MFLAHYFFQVLAKVLKFQGDFLILNPDRMRFESVFLYQEYLIALQKPKSQKSVKMPL